VIEKRLDSKKVPPLPLMVGLLYNQRNELVNGIKTISINHSYSTNLSEYNILIFLIEKYEIKSIQKQMTKPI